MRKIITKISERYAICPYGIKGMEVMGEGRSVKTFNAGETKLENWAAAVRYAEQKEKENVEERIKQRRFWASNCLTI